MNLHVLAPSRKSGLDLASSSSGSRFGPRFWPLSLQDHTEPFVLMADALDESQEPVSIAASVLRRLAGLPGCRVVVGSRRSTKEGPDQPDTDDENLINALGRGEGTSVLEVRRDSEAIGQYVCRRLEAARSNGTLPKDFDVDDVGLHLSAYIFTNQ